MRIRSTPLVVAAALTAALVTIGPIARTRVCNSSLREPVPSTISGPTASAASGVARGRDRGFVPNLGQWDHAARYVWRRGSTSAFLLDRGWVLDSCPQQAVAGHGAPDDDEESAKRVSGASVCLTFAGSSSATELVPEGELPGVHHYFLGDDSRRWRTDVPRYASIRYRGLYRGVDVRMRQQDGHLEYDLLCAANAALASVVITVEGATSRLRLDDDGSLLIDTAVGPIRQPVPSTWEYTFDGHRREVDCEYVLLGRDCFGFAAPGWTRQRNLVIDPGLLWSTFLGGSSHETAFAVAVDAQGAATVAGHASQNFPTTIGAYSTTANAQDAFVSRLTASGSNLVWSTFLGGARADRAQAIVLDPQGVVTLTGTTFGAGFPTTSGAHDTIYGGRFDGFVARLSSSGSRLIYSTYLGGSNSDLPSAIAVDGQGVATIAGSTHSSDFPTTGGAYDRTINGGSDAFVTQLDSQGSSLVYSTFLGGSKDDWAYGVAVDPQGAATVAGETQSSGFPTTAGALDRSYNGFSDAFVTRITASGAGLEWSTFLGGAHDERARDVALDTRGAVTVSGYTLSPLFPTTPGSFDRSLGGTVDGFVARLASTGKSLEYSTFLGGSGEDHPRALAVDARGAATVAGDTSSANFPTTNGAYDRSYSGMPDGFVTRLSPSGARLQYSTFLDGAAPDALALDDRNAATVTGSAAARFQPNTTPGAYDRTHNGLNDVFVSRLDMLPTGVAAFGSSSPGCAGPLAASVTSKPYVGNSSFAVTGGNAPPNASGLLLLGVARLTTAQVVNGAGLWVDPTPPSLLIATVQSDGIGSTSAVLPIPNVTGLVNSTVYVQLAWGGPTTPNPCPPLGLSASHALAITIQP